jgi:agarase
LGYFTDNERPWRHDDEAEVFLKLFLQLPSSSAGHQAALKASRSGKAGIEAFREKAAEIYFKTTAEAFRKADPNHMILGCRFAGKPALSVLKKMKGCADVISINNYQEKPPNKLIQEMSSAADLPVIVTEFSFKGPAPGLEQDGSGPVKNSQEERVRGYESYVRNLLELDCCVGYHWFKWSETWQGVLQANGQPFPELTQSFKEMNRQAESLH